jgi:hypothetical protein
MRLLIIEESRPCGRQVLGMKGAKAKKQVALWEKKLNKAEAAGDMQAVNRAIEKIIYWEKEYEAARS